jgi:hypothetical protein
LMSRSGRGIPKEIAAFGERQFEETGAAEVEVLRVKASTLRRHFRDLRGVAFLVAVVSLDRVRVYFFTGAGAMVIGENLEPAAYSKIRKTSRLVAKFEKPRELTPEEKRIEATDEIRTEFGRALRRVSRYLGIKEPQYPDLFVAHELAESGTQSFGTEFTGEGEVVFDERVLSQEWTEPVLDRAAFVVTLPVDHRGLQSAGLVGNGLALSLLKKGPRSDWLERWFQQSKATEWAPYVKHFSRHADTYRGNHYNWLASVLAKMKTEGELDAFSEVLGVLHSGCLLPVGTEEYHRIARYCRDLNAPRRLLDDRHSLPSIHLAPRMFAFTETLGLTLSDGPPSEGSDVWGSVTFVEGPDSKCLVLGEGGERQVERFEYLLNLEDSYPSTGGLISQGRYIVRRALTSLGLTENPATTLEASIEPSESTLNAREGAVLERLLIGDAEVIHNSLVGSPQIVESLVKKGRIVFLPDFNHLGISPEFLLSGDYREVRDVVRENAIESSLFKAGGEAYALVAAPSLWRMGVMETSRSRALSIWPVLSVSSRRRVLRDEALLG